MGRRRERSGRGGGGSRYTILINCILNVSALHSSGERHRQNTNYYFYFLLVLSAVVKKASGLLQEKPQ